MPLPGNFARRPSPNRLKARPEPDAGQGTAAPPSPGTQAPSALARRDATQSAARRARVLHAAMEESRRSGAMRRGMLLPNAERFASQYTVGRGIYWSRFDEALRDNWQNALALNRSEFVQELINHRQWPVAALSWHIEVDDENDDDQKRAAELMTKQIDSIPLLGQLRKYLLEDEWYGKFGSQLTWDSKAIDGQLRVTVVDHEPVNGDSIVYKYDKTPGVLMRAGWSFSNAVDERWVEKPNPQWVQPADRGRALFLYDRYWRDHFIISNFEPYGADFLYEGDKAAGIFGYGIRGRFYWALQNRDELRSWLYEALQRIGANGMLYGWFESGNTENMDAVIEALMMLLRDNISAFPVEKGQVPNKLEHIEPSGVQYEIMFKEIERIEDSLRRAIVGQDLSAVSHSTGIGAGATPFQESTFDNIKRLDANRQEEVLTRDLIGPMVRFNKWAWKGEMCDGFLPFGMRFRLELDRANATERAQVIGAALGWGLELSKEAAYKDCGLSPPKDPSDVLKQQQPTAGPGAIPGGTPGGPGGDSAPGHGGPTVLDKLRERKGLPVGNGQSADGHAPNGQHPNGKAGAGNGKPAAKLPALPAPNGKAAHPTNGRAA